MDVFLPYNSEENETRPSPNERKLPVILYLHGGGWAFGDKKDVHLKPHFFTRNGFAFVSMNYRLRWDYKVYDQLVDVVSALRWIEEEGAAYGLDGSKIVLMGHAAGGHLASLVMTDPSYLKAEGMSALNVKAVISIDSISYDVPRLMRELGSFIERRQHELIFTGDEKVWAAASPVTHVGKGEYIPAFALLYNPELDSSSLQARGFAKTLSEANVSVIMIPGSVDAPSQTDEIIGTVGNITTIALMAFLRSQI
ncbi:MAG: arylformamidase [Candidatus Azotimanducaceae bacterium]